MKTNKIELRQRHEAMFVRYYNAIAEADADTYEDVPESVRLFLSELEYIDLIRPLILQDLRNGVDQKIMKIRYGVKRSTIRGVGRRFGFYARASVHTNRAKVST